MHNYYCKKKRTNYIEIKERKYKLQSKNND